LNRRSDLIFHGRAHTVGDLADVNVKCVLASKKTAGGLGKAESRGIPTRVLAPKDFDTTEEFSDAITSSLVL